MKRDVILKKSYEETVDLRDARARETAVKEMRLAKAIMEILNRAYPGHPWLVKVDAKGKTKAALIKLPAIMRAQDYYVLPLWFLLSGSLNDFEAKVRDAGGNLMERFNIPRSGFQEDPFQIARHARIRNPNAKVPT